jgi:hypothetical protein
MRGIEVTVPADVAELAQKVAGHNGESWAHNCHLASIQIVKSGLYPGSRVARGAARGVGGQHSWVVLARDEDILADCYAEQAKILDPTLWSYDAAVTEIWTGRNLRRHMPHGLGTMELDFLPTYDGTSRDEIEMPAAIAETLSYKARDFLLKVGAMGYSSRRIALPPRNWMAIANAPILGWPAAEINEAMYRTPGLSPFTRIDIVGMLTTINPGGLYLPGEEEEL